MNIIEELKNVIAGLAVIATACAFAYGAVLLMETEAGGWLLVGVLVLGFAWVFGALIRFDPSRSVGDGFGDH